MIEVGSKVYVWSKLKEEVAVGTFSREQIIGNVTKVLLGGLVIIKSIMDDKEYVMELDDVHEVGTGPIMMKSDKVWDDYYV